MCLIPLELNHRIASQPILVYKVLVPVFGNTAETPFMGTRIFFDGEGTAIINGNLPETHHGVIEEGVHAYRKKGLADYKSTWTSGSVVHYAVIPVGGRYFKGEYDDIVSDKLIVFKTYVDFKNYMKKVQ